MFLSWIRQGFLEKSQKHEPYKENIDKLDLIKTVSSRDTVQEMEKQAINYRPGAKLCKNKNKKIPYLKLVAKMLNRYSHNSITKKKK